MVAQESYIDSPNRETAIMCAVKQLVPMNRQMRGDNEHREWWDWPHCHNQWTDKCEVTMSTVSDETDLIITTNEQTNARWQWAPWVMRLTSLSQPMNRQMRGDNEHREWWDWPHHHNQWTDKCEVTMSTVSDETDLIVTTNEQTNARLQWALWVMRLTSSSQPMNRQMRGDNEHCEWWDWPHRHNQWTDKCEVTMSTVSDETDLIVTTNEQTNARWQWALWVMRLTSLSQPMNRQMRGYNEHCEWWDWPHRHNQWTDKCEVTMSTVSDETDLIVTTNEQTNARWQWAPWVMRLTSSSQPMNRQMRGDNEHREWWDWPHRHNQWTDKCEVTMSTVSDETDLIVTTNEQTNAR